MNITLDQTLELLKKLCYSIGILSIDFVINQDGTIVAVIKEKDNEAILLFEEAREIVPTGPCIGVNDFRIVLQSSDFSKQKNSQILFSLRKICEKHYTIFKLWFSASEYAIQKNEISYFELYTLLNNWYSHSYLQWKDLKFSNIEVSSENDGIIYFVFSIHDTLLEIPVRCIQDGFFIKQCNIPIELFRDLDEKMHEYVSVAVFLLRRWFSTIPEEGFKITTSHTQSFKSLYQKKKHSYLYDYCKKFIADQGYEETFFLDIYQVLDLPTTSILNCVKECPISATYLSGKSNNKIRPWEKQRSFLPVSNKILFSYFKNPKSFVNEKNLLECCATSPKKSSLCIYNSCTSIMYNGHASITRVKKELEPDRKIVSLDYMNATTDENIKFNSWYSILNLIESNSNKEKHRAINFIGYGQADSKSINEIRCLLAMFDIKVNSVIYPEFTVFDKEHFCEATLTLLNPWDPIKKIFIPFLDSNAIRYLAIPIPFGFEGLYNWLKEICQFFNIETQELHQKFKDKAKWLPRNKDLPLHQKQEFSICFVSNNKLDAFFDSANFYGMDFLGSISDLHITLYYFQLQEQIAEPRQEEMIYKGVRLLIHYTHNRDEVGEKIKVLKPTLLYCEPELGVFSLRYGIIPLRITDMWWGITGYMNLLQKITIAQSYHPIQTTISKEFERITAQKTSGSKLPILFVHFTNSTFPQIINIPLGMVSIVNYLKDNGLNVHFLNYEVEKKVDNDFSIIDFIKTNNIKAVFADLFWAYQTFVTLQNLTEIKSACKEIVTVLGGMTATYCAKEILHSFPSIDIIIKDSVKEQSLHLIKNVLSGANKSSFIIKANSEAENSLIKKSVKRTHESTPFFCIDDYNIELLNNHETYLSICDNLYVPFEIGGCGLDYNCDNCPAKKSNYNKDYIKRKVIDDDQFYRLLVRLKRLHVVGLNCLCIHHDEIIQKFLRFQELLAGFEILYDTCRPFTLKQLKRIANVNIFNNIYINEFTADNDEVDDDYWNELQERLVLIDEYKIQYTAKIIVKSFSEQKRWLQNIDKFIDKNAALKKYLDVIVEFPSFFNNRIDLTNKAAASIVDIYTLQEKGMYEPDMHCTKNTNYSLQKIYKKLNGKDH